MGNRIVGVMMLVLGLTVAVTRVQTGGAQRVAQPARSEAAADVPTDPAALGYLELRKRHPDASEGAPADVARARTAYALATRNFQEFWDTRLPTD